MFKNYNTWTGKYGAMKNKRGILIPYTTSSTCILINALAVLKEFYSLLALESSLKPVYGKHSHDRFIEDFYQYKNWFCTVVSKMMYDYICIICLGEMRHALNYSEFFIDDFPNSDYGRTSVYNGQRNWTQESVLEIAVKLFNEFYNLWDTNFGGTKWYMIAKGGQLYNKVANEVFIDYVFDLEHNGGNIFDKEAYSFYCVSRSLIKQHLDDKRYESPNKIMRWAQSRELQTLIERANNIGIIPEIWWQDFSLVETPMRLSSETSINYFNQFYSDEDRICSEWGKWTLTDALHKYHPLPWGTRDLRKNEIKPSGNINRVMDDERRKQIYQYYNIKEAM